jgi:EpsI family protein
MRTLAMTWVGHDRLEGFLIPLLSLYLVWMKRKELEHLPIQPTVAWGLPLVLLAALLLLFGEMGSMLILSEMSPIVMVAGLILLLLGKSFLRRLSLPLAFLFLMLPLLEDIVAPANFPLQLLTARQGVAILRALGYPALVDRQFIVLPHITLEVARACSGVNYLLSILAVGIPLAYLMLRTWKGRALLILSALVIGIASNWIRVLLIAIWTSFDSTAIHGPAHVFQGMFVAWLGYVWLYIGARSIARVENPLRRGRPAVGAPPPGNGRTRVQVHPPSIATPALRAEGTLDVNVSRFEPMALPCEVSRRRHWNRAWRIGLLTMGSLLAYLSLHHTSAVALKTDFASFPPVIGGWSGEPGDINSAGFRLPGADGEFLRTYRKDQAKIHVYVAYFASQRSGKESASYLTDALLQDARQIDIRIDSRQSVAVNENLGRTGQGNRRLLFWYDVNGRIVANRHSAKLANLLNMVCGGRSSGAFVLLALDSPQAEGLALSPDENTFVQRLVLILRQYLAPTGSTPMGSDLAGAKTADPLS